MVSVDLVRSPVSCLLSFAVAVALAGCVTAADEPVADESAVGTSTAEVKVSAWCNQCVAACCSGYGAGMCGPEERFECAADCWHNGVCTTAEYFSFRPRLQEP